MTHGNKTTSCSVKRCGLIREVSVAESTGTGLCSNIAPFVVQLFLRPLWCNFADCIYMTGARWTNQRQRVNQPCAPAKSTPGRAPQLSAECAGPPCPPALLRKHRLARACARPESSLREHARPCSSDWCWPVVQSSCPVVDDWTTGQHQSQQAAPKSGPPTGLYFFPTVFEGASAYQSICRDGADGADHRHRRRRGPNQGHDAAGHRSRAARDWQRLQNRPDGPR